MRRQVDISFDAGESLFRAVSKQDVDSGDRVKPNRLRLQVSVVRGRYDESGESCLNGDRNGIVRADAARVAQVQSNNVRTACVDDPNEELNAHALIALHARPGDAVTENDVSDARQRIADAMKLTRKPFKPAKPTPSE